MGKRYTGAEVDTWSCGVILYAMLTGYLPFDEDNQSLLVKKICTGNFTIPETVSPDAADLITKMLKVHPLERIKMSDIKRHNFFNSSERANYILQDASAKEDHYKVSNHILNKLLNLQFDFKGLDLNEIKDSIRTNKNFSFVIGYQLLEDHFKREQQAKSTPQNQPFFGFVKTLLDENAKAIDDFYMDLLEERQSHIIDKDGGYVAWKYGLIYKAKESGPVMNVVIETLGQMGVAFVIKGSDYCLKCNFGD